MHEVYNVKSFGNLRHFTSKRSVYIRCQNVTSWNSVRFVNPVIKLLDFDVFITIQSP